MAAVKHRQVFGADGIDIESLLEEMAASLDAYEFALGEGPGTLELLAVLYGAATPAAIAGIVWQKFRLAARLRTTAPENPFAARVAVLQKRGARFVVCNNSLRGLAIAVANGVPDVQEPVDDVLSAMRANLLRGVSIVPAGVAAIDAAQAAGYTYVPASLPN
jgi:intracellular sulfur oxidation DsrE/DsrF family protein